MRHVVNAAGCGPARSAGWSASSCRSWRWSTCTSHRGAPGLPTGTSAAARCCTASTSAARSTCARRATGCCSAPTSATACRGRRARPRGTFGMQLLDPTSTASPSRSRSASPLPDLRRGGIKQVDQRAVHLRPDGNPLLGPVRACPATGRRARSWPGCRRAAASAGARQLDDRGRPGLRRVGHGLRPLRRLRHPRLHQREGARELLAPVPHRVPERGAARRRAVHTSPIYDRLDRPTRCGATLSASSTRSGSRRRARSRSRTSRFGAPTRGTGRRGVGAVRERVGLIETTNFAKYSFTGPGARAYLDRVLTNELPPPAGWRSRRCSTTTAS